MQTTLNAAVESYLQSKSLTGGTRKRVFFGRFANGLSGAAVRRSKDNCVAGDIREFL